MPSNVGCGIPAMADYINLYNSNFSPSTIHVTNTSLSNFFKRYLFQKAIGVLKWTLPETWCESYFKYVLFAWGFIGVVETDKFGVICQAGAPYGYDIYYQPTQLIITNPLLKGSLQPRIGEECEVIKLMPDWGGIMDLVNYYADMMALAAEAVAINWVNSHCAFVFPAEKDSVAQSYKKMYDKIAAGQPAVVVDKSLFKEDGSVAWEPFIQNVGQNYITDKLISDLRKLEAEFDTIVGIPNTNTDKRERLNVPEVNANNVETNVLSDTWLDNLNDGITKVNDMFGLNIKVEKRYPDPEGGGQDALERNDVSAGTV